MQDYPDCILRILSSEFDNLLPENLRKEAEMLYGRSKPRIGRHVAQKLVDTGDIPKEIVEIIEDIKRL